MSGKCEDPSFLSPPAFFQLRRLLGLRPTPSFLEDSLLIICTPARFFPRSRGFRSPRTFFPPFSRGVVPSNVARVYVEVAFRRLTSTPLIERSPGALMQCRSIFFFLFAFPTAGDLYRGRVRGPDLRRRFLFSQLRAPSRAFYLNLSQRPHTTSSADFLIRGRLG